MQPIFSSLNRNKYRTSKIQSSLLHSSQGGEHFLGKSGARLYEIRDGKNKKIKVDNIDEYR